MSAIWGEIQYTDDLDTNIQCMKAIYEKKCKLDRIAEQATSKQLFGCGLQYITEESKEEQLPIHSEEAGILFTADCILDNRKELMPLLEITDPKTPDGTIMYQAYLKWGFDCVTRFKGIYTLAAYDTAKNTLFLATDPIASRCLYYYQTEQGCTFSTLLDPILKSHPGRKRNELYLEDFLVTPGLRPNISATETPYEDIYKIECGTYVVITPNHKHVERYWTPQELPIKIRNASECKDHFLSIFKRCVARTLRTSGEVGMALSSGFDSSSVAAFAALNLEQSKKTLHSYTYVPYYKDQSNLHESYMVTDEEADVKKMLAMYPNIKASFLDTDGQDFYQSLDDMLSIMEIPFKAFVNLPSLYELFDHASKDNCKIFLTGQYGNATISFGNIDNILYDKYIHKHYLSYLLTLNKYCKKAKESRKMAFKGCQRYFKESDEVYHSKEQSYQATNQFVNKKLVKEYPFKERYKHETLPQSKRVALPKDIYEGFLYYPSALTYIGEYETKFGLANGIVLRDPTRDPEIISFCHTMPFKYFAYQGTPRWLVRGCLKEYLPHDNISSFYRYGLQNADWAYRVALNWESIWHSLKANLETPALAGYIDSEEISTFLTENKDFFSDTIYQTSLYLFFLDIFSRFLSNNE